MTEPIPLDTTGRDPGWCARKFVETYLSMESLDRDEAELDRIHADAKAELQGRRENFTADMKTLSAALSPLTPDLPASRRILVEIPLLLPNRGHRFPYLFLLTLYRDCDTGKTLVDFARLESAESLKWPVALPPTLDAGLSEEMARAFEMPTLEGSPVLFDETFGPVYAHEISDQPPTERTLLIPSHPALDAEDLAMGTEEAMAANFRLEANDDSF